MTTSQVITYLKTQIKTLHAERKGQQKTKQFDDLSYKITTLHILYNQLRKTKQHTGYDDLIVAGYPHRFHYRKWLQNIYEQGYTELGKPFDGLV